jgi:poly(A) polymerase
VTVRLDPTEQAWMRSPAAHAVIDALETARAGSVRFVGGCVRNALMGEPVSDIDLATQLTPPETIAALEAAGLRAIPTGIEHGTVTALAHGQTIEVTTLRRDVATDGRRAVVAFTDDWTEDSQRRDFRLNAIYCAPDGAVFDPQDGVADARARRIVFIGDADARIAEDALRILRFFRFHAQFGRGAPDRDGLLACVRAKDSIAGLSGERVWAEMRKLLSAPAPETSLRWMQTSGVLRAALGPCEGLETAVQMASLRREHDWPRDALLMLAALTLDGGGADEMRAEALAKRLKMTRAERARLGRAARITCAKIAGDSPADPKNDSATEKKLHRDGKDAVADEARLCWARARAAESRTEARNDADDDAHTHYYGAMLARAMTWTAPKFPISGKDLQNIGFEEGKSLGDVLAALETRWIDSKFTLDKSELMMLAASLRRKDA